MRKFHRWISTVGMLFMTYLVITGTVLAVQEILGPRTFESMPVPAPTLPADKIEQLAATTLQAALANNNGETSGMRLQLRIKNGQTQGLVTFAGNDARTLLFNAETGELLPPEKPVVRPGPRIGPKPLNAILQSLHSGEIVGVGTQWFIILVGIGLVILSITGIWMYFQLLSARRKRGRNELFWT
ncbi:MAG: PepSY-associated TM helix domain-containing protein [Steroidobacteraceae bacterium]